MRKGSKITEEHRKKLSLAKLGKYRGEAHWNWKGGRKAWNERRNIERRQTFTCKDCTAQFAGRQGNSSPYCDQCIKVSCLCLYCLTDFTISRNEFNDGRGLYCSRQCNASFMRQNPLQGERSPSWKGGHGKESWYMRPYRMAYRARRINAEGSFTAQEWGDLVDKYNHTCLMCKKQEPEIHLSVDHIIPLSKGGDNYITNIQPLCTRCNSKKSNRIISFV